MRSPVAATIEQLLGFFIRSGAAWVDAQRSYYRAVGKPLDDHGRQRVHAFFSPATLDSVRVARVPVIANPPFYPALEVRAYRLQRVFDAGGSPFDVEDEVARELGARPRQ